MAFGCLARRSEQPRRRNRLMTASMAVQAITAEDVDTASNSLESKSPQAILRWAVAEFYPRLTMATAFGAEGCCIIHMLADIEPNVRIFNLETGYQFQETLDLRERIKHR